MTLEARGYFRSSGKGGPVVTNCDNPGGASYSPQLDQTRPRRRLALPPKERDARAKARQQARFRAMDAPTLRREYIILSRKAEC